jgi:primosomal protein N' (replication factor Y)
MIYHILLPIAIDREFDYVSDLEIPFGSFVQVPFGSKVALGVVWGKSTKSDFAKLKEITAIAEIAPLPKKMLKFIDFVSSYNLAQKGMVLKMLMPPPQLKRKSKKPEIIKEYHYTPPKFSQEQEGAIADLRKKTGGFNVSVINGVTGSGKTEVYFNIAAEILKNGGQVLILLPEIILTNQLLRKFEERFGVVPDQWHSDIKPKDKRAIWHGALSGKTKLVIGARSALFLPFKNLQLTIIDEEHDSSYKQEEGGVVYHARDMAVMRAHIEKAAVILSSATPSLESLVNIEKGKFHEVKLDGRFGEAIMPEIKLLDMKQEPKEKGDWLAQSLREKIAVTIAKNQQVLLFLNRRGYSPLRICGACGHRFKCKNCDVFLVEHKKRNCLTCHYCGYEERAPDKCSACGKKDDLVSCGPGVERIAEEVTRYFPQARIVVLTSDTLTKPAETKKLMQEITDGEVDIIIGTQMIAKGHHFPKLTLVGVVDADLGLNGGDLRAGERTLQLIHQVAGRAGREANKGQVYIQTYLPETLIMQSLASGDIDEFIKYEIESRKISHMPPFANMAALIISGRHADMVKKVTSDIFLAMPKIQAAQILGPIPAPIYFLRGNYRHRLLIKADKNFNIQKFISYSLAQIKIPSAIRIKIDIDPYSFL